MVYVSKKRLIDYQNLIANKKICYETSVEVTSENQILLNQQKFQSSVFSSKLVEIVWNFYGVLTLNIKL